jgi:hypothetical protein
MRHPFAIGEDFDICLRLSEVGRVGNVPEVVLLYRQHLTSTANSGRAKCDTYSRLVRQMAAERRATGSDRLMRGEEVKVEFGELPSARQSHADTYRRWGWWALGEGHVGTARKYARKALVKDPLSVEGWKLLACAVRGR